MAGPLAFVDDGESPFAGQVTRSAAQVKGFGTDVDATLRWVVRTGITAPLPGSATLEVFEVLATTAALDVGAARMLEPHLDAHAILAQAGLEDVPADSSWGVFAAEGPGVRVDAACEEGRWMLSGTKPWCSLAGSLSHALVTAWVDDTQRALFAVALRDPSVTARPGPWVARGLSQVVSAPVDFDRTPAVEVGGPRWYLERPGFAWGGIGVAAVWWGAAVPIVERLTDAARRPDADQLASVAAGEADAAMWAARTVLNHAAARIDAHVAGSEAKILAERTRAVVAGAAERVLTLADHALGPAPLATDERYARRVSDLRMYLRQHHGERDVARLGRLVSG